MSNLPKISVAELLDAGVHFGHKTSRWNPKMAPYIYGVRDTMHIIDLQQTVPLMQIALQKIYETVKTHGKVLFVGSKVQASELIAEYAEKSGQFYVNNRWLGGMLTNWGTISKSIKKLEEIEKALAEEDLVTSYTKKEILDFTRKREKLLRGLAGIRKMGGVPDLLVVIDTNREHLAISEALKLKVPIIAIVDTNSNPDNIDYPIPGNDDAIRSIKLYCNIFAEAVLAGIQDSLADSGVDIGLSTKVTEEDKTLDGVKKLEKTAKVSKARPARTDQNKTKVVKAGSDKPKAVEPLKPSKISEDKKVAEEVVDTKELL